MDWFRFDPANYDVGSDLWLSEQTGWRGYRAIRFVVTKKTPTGRITAERHDGYTIRLSARGDVVGAGRWSRSRVCSAAEAAEYNAASDKEAEQRRLSKLADDLSTALRKGNDDEAANLFAQLASGMEAATAAETETGSVHDSPTAATSGGDAQNPSQITPSKHG